MYLFFNQKQKFIMQIKKILFRAASSNFKLLLTLATGFLLNAVNTLNAQATFQLRDGVVLDKVRNEVYITSPSQKVQAISANTGAILWTGISEGRPLVVVNGKLLCQGKTTGAENQFTVLELDLNQKGAQVSKYLISMPANVKAGFMQNTDGSFIVSSKIVNNNIYLFWQYFYKPMRRIMDSTDQQQEARAIIDSGVFQFDKTSKKLKTIRKDLVSKEVQMQRSILLTSDNMKAADKNRKFISADGMHAMSSIKVASDSIFLNYRWEIFEISSGNKIGELMDYRSYAPFYINGNTIIYERGPYIINTKNELMDVPLQLVAIDIGNRNQVWKKEIYDFIYRGPYPSAPGN